MLEFNVQAMSCGHCVTAVTQAVQSVDATAKVEVDLASHRVTEQTAEPRDKVVAALIEAGYAPN
ncbi:MAG: copper resistance protein CopZ [Rhizobacter sp.]|nr:copper resistance protein CopZ [Rhizobacter sp.]